MGETDSKTTVEQEQDDFSKAFADLAANLKEPGTPAVEATAATETPEAKAAREAAAAAAATETPEAKAAREAAAAAAAAAATETPEAKAAREAAAADVAAQLAEAKAEVERLRAAAATATPAETPEAKAAREAAAAKPLYTADEQAVLDKYKAEWDVVMKGEELIRRAEYRQLVGYIFEQIRQTYDPALAYVEARSGKDQYKDIKDLVPDYDQVRNPTIAWVDKQPPFLKNAYTKVITEGTPEEVRDLIDIFKKATGVAPAPAATTTTPAGSGMATAASGAVDAAKAAAIAALKPVDSARTQQTQGADPNDFNAAFAEFAK